MCVCVLEISFCRPFVILIVLGAISIFRFCSRRTDKAKLRLPQMYGSHWAYHERCCNAENSLMWTRIKTHRNQHPGPNLNNLGPAANTQCLNVGKDWYQVNISILAA